MTGRRPARRIAITGAAGSLASDIIPGLQQRGYDIVAIDQQAPKSSFNCEWNQCSINDRKALAAGLAGCDAVVHLAGIPLEADWQDLLHANIDGTHSVLETAHEAGINRVILASSIHAAGYVPIPNDGSKIEDDVAIRPNTFYGVTKAAAEALGSLYHYRYGMDIVCLRIASRFSAPQGERMLSTWLSPGDAVRLFDACLTVEAPGFRTVWGVSANTRGYLSPAGGASIGFSPEDDAEDHAEALFDAGSNNPSLPASEWDQRFIGGIFCSPTPPRIEQRSTT